MILAIYECTRNYRFSRKFDLTIFGCLSLSDCISKMLKEPLNLKSFASIGDVVVGRVTEVQQKRWKVDVNGR